jgi:GDPmannose 4,6-dehydratase
MKRVLVTGITGQDGGYLADVLTRDGHEVHGLVHVDDARVAALSHRCPDVVLNDGDVLDGAGLRRLVDEIEPDEVYNLAGISSVARSWQEPLLTAEVCGMGAARILEIAWGLTQRTGRNVRVLQASSAEIFGEPAKAPQDESTPVQPQSPYGAAKAFAHHLVSVYRDRGLHAVSVVLYNHESPRRPLGFVSRKISRGVAEIALGRRDVLVLGNSDARRDWGWAPDYVDAMVRALRHPIPDDYVIATGHDRSVRDFAAAAFARVGIPAWEGLVRTDPALVRPVDPALLVGDAGKARDRLHWSPTVGFEEIVARMVDADLNDLRQGW